MHVVHRFAAVLAIIAAALVVTAMPSSAAISVHMEVTKVQQGQLAYATGQTDPGQKIVFVQRWNGSRWYDITGATVFPDGSFRAALRPKDRGIYTFRVRSKSGRSLSGRFYLNVLAPPPPVYFSTSGEDNYTGPYFYVPNEWKFVYTFDCSNWSSHGGNFIAHAEHDDGDTEFLANDLAVSGSKTVYVHNGAGRVYLDIISECRWSVKVTG